MMHSHSTARPNSMSLFMIGAVLVLNSYKSQGVFAQDESSLKKQEKPVLQKVQITKDGMLPDGKIIVQANHSEQERKIFEALESQSAFNFTQNPIGDVVDFLSTFHNIPILIDNIALRSSGLTTDFEVELVVENVQFKKGLRSLLRPYGLDYIVRNDVLEITTTDIAAAYMETRVYNVRPLRVTEPDALADVLAHTTGRTAWEETGIGGLSYFNGSFVIKQNQETHEEIEAVLNQLANDIQNSAETPEWGVRDRSYAQPLQNPSHRDASGTTGSGQGFF